MRVLILSKSVLDRRYGAGKLLVELAAALAAQGIDVDLAGPDTLGTDLAGLPAATEAHLAAVGARYDVVEMDYKVLRAEAVDRLRSGWEGGPALVARLQLWRGLLLAAPAPPPLPGLRARLGHRLKGGARRAQLAAAVAADLALLRRADGVVVSNPDDRADLVARGVDAGRIAVVTPGFDVDAARALAAVAEAPLLDPPVVAFVGAFSPRKGGGDFPALFRRLAARVPGVRLRLVGTRGVLRTAAAVRAAFPRQLRDRVEVVPAYAPDALPGLLAGCVAGVFPSYAEGFGYGVLEMLAAGLPVVAYDRPGPPLMLGPEALVPAGRPGALADALADLLSDPPGLAAARTAAAARAASFAGWEPTAAATAAVYRAACSRLAPLPE